MIGGGCIMDLLDVNSPLALLLTPLKEVADRVVHEYERERQREYLAVRACL